jgi:hypothetical protein
LAALILVVSLVLGQAGVAFAAAADIAGHWAQPQVEKWMAKGLLSGYPDGTVRPNNPVTRAEFVVFINRAAVSKNPNATCDFTDVPQGQWFYADVASAVAAGYVTGYADKTYKPSQMITRQEAAVILARVLKLQPGDVSLVAQFTDAPTIAEWAKPSVASIVAKGVIKGYADGTFAPLRSITRAESVVMMDRGIVSPTEATLPPTTPTAPPIAPPPTTPASPAAMSIVPSTSVLGQFVLTTNVDTTLADIQAAVVAPNLAWTTGSSAKTYVGTISTASPGTTYSLNVDASKFALASGVDPRVAWAAPAISSVVLSSSTPSAMLNPGGTLQLGALVKNQYGATMGGVPVNWSSSDLGKATVANGVVTAVAPGAANITASAGSVSSGPYPIVVRAPGALGSATVTLGAGALDFVKVATVTVTGYPTATQYRLVKMDGVNAYTGKRTFGPTVNVIALNTGDQCKVEVYDSAGTLLGIEVVTVK